MKVTQTEYEILKAIEIKNFPYKPGTPAYPSPDGGWLLFPSFKDILEWVYLQGENIQLYRTDEGFGWRLTNTESGAFIDDSKYHGSDEMIAQGIFPNQKSALCHGLRITLNHIKICKN